MFRSNSKLADELRDHLDRALVLGSEHDWMEIPVEWMQRDLYMPPRAVGIDRLFAFVSLYRVPLSALGVALGPKLGQNYLPLSRAFNWG